MPTERELAGRVSFSSRVAAYFGALFLGAMGVLFALWYLGLPQLGLAGAGDQRLIDATRALEHAADLQQAAILDALGERRGDMLILAEGRVIAKQLEDDDTELEQNFQRVTERLLRAYPDHYLGLVIVDPDTRKIRASNDGAELGREFPDRELIARATRPGVTELIEQFGKPGAASVAIVRQIHAPNEQGQAYGRLIGILVSVLDTRSLVAQGMGGDAHDDSRSGTVLLLDFAGQQVAAESVGRPSGQAFRVNPRMLPGFEGTLQEDDGHGASRIAVYRHIALIGAQGWTLVRYLNNDEALAGLNERAKLLVLVGLLLAVASLALITLASRRISRPLRTLARTASRLGDGELSVRAQLPAGETMEVAEIAEAFNGMASNIERAHSTLEQKVQERTAELAQERNRAQGYLDIAAIMLMALDRAGRIAMINQKGAALLGAPEAALLGRDWFEYFVPEAERAATRRVFQQLMSGDLPAAARCENTVRNVRGEQMTLAWNNTVVLDEAGAIVGTLSSAEDVTEHRRVERQIRLSEENLRITLESIGDAVIATDANGRIKRMNATAQRLTGWPLEEAAGMPLLQVFRIVNAQTRLPCVDPVQVVMERGEIVGLANHTLLLARGGNEYQISDSAAPIRDDSGNIVGVVLVFSDVTARYLAEEALRIAATAFESQEGMTVTDAEQVILRVNGAFSAITGYSAEEVVGQTPRLLRSGRHDAAFYAAMWDSIASTGAWKGEIWNRRKNGEVFPEWLSITAVKNDAAVATHYVATFTDITVRKSAEDQIMSLAFFDPLTHLPNRRLLIDRLEQALAAASRHQRRGALLFVDLDNFKAINDTLGHYQGDLLLQQVAKRLSACIREGDTVARLGGDEFVVMLQDLNAGELEAAAQAENIGEKILAALNQNYQLGSHDHHSTPSIGITLFGADTLEGVDEPLKRADLAMYQAKAAGRNTLRFFEPQMQAIVMARAALESSLRMALENREFELY